ncbi:hypothetical protein CDD83_4884 [Cordyceps sp. RAO-2017]|nr:hypothetical protein CDD83_4884 [Cordyceps sp. RAO-2017]
MPVGPPLRTILLLRHDDSRPGPRGTSYLGNPLSHQSAPTLESEDAVGEQARGTSVDLTRGRYETVREQPPRPLCFGAGTGRTTAEGEGHDGFMCAQRWAQTSQRIAAGIRPPPPGIVLCRLRCGLGHLLCLTLLCLTVATPLLPALCLGCITSLPRAVRPTAVRNPSSDLLHASLPPADDRYWVRDDAAPPLACKFCLGQVV